MIFLCYEFNYIFVRIVAKHSITHACILGLLSTNGQRQINKDNRITRFFFFHTFSFSFALIVFIPFFVFFSIVHADIFHYKRILKKKYFDRSGLRIG